MLEPRLCEQVAQRLAQHGIPSTRIRRVTRELAEHWEDLYAGALRDGLSAAEAWAAANARLGRPNQLASSIIDGMRRSSWFGRHAFLSLCVLPLLLAPVLMALVAFPLALLDEWTHFTYWGGPGNEPNAYLITSALWLLHYGAMLGSLCWLGYRIWKAGLGRNWIVAICLWCALSALFRYFDADPIKRSVVLSFGFPWRLNVHTAIVLFVHALAAAAFLFRVKPNQNEICNSLQTTELV